MITPGYVRLMAEYNQEMNRRLYAAAARLTDDQRKADRNAFWHSIHGTLCHLVWGDTQWMSRFDAWPKPEVGIKQSASMIDDFAHTAGTPRDRRMPISSPGPTAWTTPGWPRTWCGSVARPARRCGVRRGRW